MSVSSPIQTLRTPGTVEGRSDARLVGQVHKQAARELAKIQPPPFVLLKRLVPAAGLNTRIQVRPIDALLRLSRATALKLPPRVASASKWWPVLRYLGAFTHVNGQLAIDPTATATLRENERRVFSEELGVGFGILLAERWCRNLGADGAISALDASIVLRKPRNNLTKVGSLIPDYILRYTQRSLPGMSNFVTLECKGTRNVSTAPKQLGHAMRQVDALRLNGSPLPGVGISTVTSSDIVFRAVDPPSDSAATAFSQKELQEARSREIAATIEQDKVFVDRDEYLKSTILLDNAALAAFGGDFTAARLWAPTSQLNRFPESHEPLHSIDNGRWRGRSLRVETATGEIEIFLGVASSVAEAMQSTDDRYVRTAQDEVLHELAPLDLDGDDDEALAIGNDGSMLMIRRRASRI